MLVKHNLAYVNGFKKPSWIGNKDKFNINLNRDSFCIKDSYTSLAGFIIDENYYIDDIAANYFIGFYGTLEGYCSMHPGNSNYNEVKNEANFYYVTARGDEVRPLLHLNVLEQTILNVYHIGVYKEEIPDVYLPNINTLPEDKQPLLPPEGNYKEIQPQ